MTEEERAAAYIAEQKARAVSHKEQLEALAGDPDARAALQEAWRPVLESRQPGRGGRLPQGRQGARA